MFQIYYDPFLLGFPDLDSLNIFTDLDSDPLYSSTPSNYQIDVTKSDVLVHIFSLFVTDIFDLT
jgi:hypothetical protein